MEIPRAVDLNRNALVRIAAGLFALLGLTAGAVPGRISREVHRTIARVLRPAESAVRRLIVVLARITNVKTPPPPRRPMPKGIVRTGRGEPRLSFSLFDPRQRFLRQQRPPKAARPSPRITFFGPDEVRTILLVREPQPKDDKADALKNPANLARRLQALQAALEDLPGQARRLARALARRQRVPRLKFKMPLRPGYAPGFRRRPVQDIDHLLHECDWLAREALAPDTS